MKRLAVLVGATALLAILGAAPASASHSWNGYHWARTSNPFTIKLGDNVSTDWKSYLGTASTDWSKSSVLDTTVVAGQSRGHCRATSGRVEVCSDRYGQNGWLGLASIWIQSGTKHIVQGTVKVNDTYFAMPQYNLTTEKLHVMCQEIGHTFGLSHQDESGASLNTCMDYYRNTSDSDTLSTHPNQHDYDELATIYSHLDASTTIGANLGQFAGAVPSLSGAAARSRSVHVKRLRNGDKLVTFVIWVDALKSTT